MDATPGSATATGYGAGVRSPGWYDHVFRHPGPDGVARFFVDAAHVLREADLQASPDHLIAATRVADALAVMRGRPRPGLAEVLDAADTVMGAAAAGRAPGSSSDVRSAPCPTMRRRCRSPATSPAGSGRRGSSRRPSRRLIELDLRTPNGLRRSHLLHQLHAIGVPWGSLEEGRGISGTFRETWRLVVASPSGRSRIVEVAGSGTTVEQAATQPAASSGPAPPTRGRDRRRARPRAAGRLADAVGPIVAVLAARAAADPDIAQLMAALGPLAQAQRYGDVRATDTSRWRTVFDGHRRARPGRARAGVRVARRRGRGGDDRAHQRRASRRSRWSIIAAAAAPMPDGARATAPSRPGTVACRAARRALLHDSR